MQVSQSVRWLSKDVSTRIIYVPSLGAVAGVLSEVCLQKSTKVARRRSFAQSKVEALDGFSARMYTQKSCKIEIVKNPVIGLRASRCI